MFTKKKKSNPGFHKNISHLISTDNCTEVCIFTGCPVAHPVILATQEAEIRRMWFKASPDK
jgi:hypothetical protein